MILGNPPWEEATLEEHAFWARREPGLRGLNQREQEKLKATLRKTRPDLEALYERELAEANAMRKALLSGSYPGMGTGDPDLYKAFCWRFWQLIANDSGWIGVVLPRGVWIAKGSTDFRKEVLSRAGAVDLTFLVNRREWVFPGVHEQNPIPVLNAIRKTTTESGQISIRGPFTSMDKFREGLSRTPAIFSSSEVNGWTDTASLPFLPSDESLEVFARLRSAPRLDLNDDKSWRAQAAYRTACDE